MTLPAFLNSEVRDSSEGIGIVDPSRLFRLLVTRLLVLHELRVLRLGALGIRDELLSFEQGEVAVGFSIVMMEVRGRLLRLIPVWIVESLEPSTEAGKLPLAVSIHYAQLTSGTPVVSEQFEA